MTWPTSSFRRVWVAALCAMAACSRSDDITAPPPAAPDTNAPAIQREMRGLWVATVANIDWPSRSTLTADQQRRIFWITVVIIPGLILLAGVQTWWRRR